MIAASWSAVGAIALLFIGLAFAVATAVLARLSGDEVSGWLPVWSNKFLESAASVVAPEYRERYREEWKAELAAFRERRLSGLRFAWRLRRRARSVNEVLIETESLSEVFEPEPVPKVRRPLDADTIAEIVRRVVDRTRPRNQRTFEEIVEEMRAILGEMDKDEVASSLTADYVGGISERRREARTRPSLPAMRPRQPVPELRRRRVYDHLNSDGRSEGRWGSDYDAEWNFLPTERDRALRRELRVRARLRKPLHITIGRVLRDWRRGEIRL